MGLVNLDALARLRHHLVRHVGCRHEQIEVELALEPLAHDLEVEQPEKAATEPEAERLRRLRLERQ